MVEIRAGTGGLEASFVQICLKCMKKYVQKKWSLEIINISKSDAGGFKEVIFSVNGNNIYSYLKYESEYTVSKEFLKQKHKEEFILHCNSCSFARGGDVDIEIKDSDLRIDVLEQEARAANCQYY